MYSNRDPVPNTLPKQIKEKIWSFCKTKQKCSAFVRWVNTWVTGEEISAHLISHIVLKVKNIYIHTQSLFVFSNTVFTFYTCMYLSMKRSRDGQNRCCVVGCINPL